MKQELTIRPSRFLGSLVCPTLPFQPFWVEEFPILKDGLSIQCRCEEAQRYWLMYGKHFSWRIRHEQGLYPLRYYQPLPDQPFVWPFCALCFPRPWIYQFEKIGFKKERGYPASDFVGINCCVLSSSWASALSFTCLFGISSKLDGCKNNEGFLSLVLSVHTLLSDELQAQWSVPSSASYNTSI